MIHHIFPPVLPEWQSAGGEDYEVVVSTEAFYVRNLQDRPFPGNLSEEDLYITNKQMQETLSGISDDFDFIETDRISDREIDYLVERQSISEEIERRKKGTGLYINKDESSWITLNTTDHLRFRFAIAGGDVETVYRRARDFAENLEQNLPFAYSERFGFLTSHPTECGTGLFIRFTVHIPGLLFSNRLPELRDSLLKSGSIIKPEFREGISSDGHLFTIQTSHTLGIDEETILENAQDMITGIAEMEYEARDSLMSKAKFQIEDKILRGIGILSHARMIAEKEGYALASALRLGSSEGMTADNLDLISATELFLVGKPAHLLARGVSDNRIEMDRSRAELFRTYLKLEG